MTLTSLVERIILLLVPGKETLSLSRSISCTVHSLDHLRSYQTCACARVLAGYILFLFCVAVSFHCSLNLIIRHVTGSLPRSLSLSLFPVSTVSYVVPQFKLYFKLATVLIRLSLELVCGESACPNRVILRTLTRHLLPWPFVSI